MHCAAQTNSDHQPQKSWQKSKLRCQHRTNQRSRAGDGREVMTEQNPFIGRIIVVAVIHRVGRHGPRIIERQDLGRDEGGIVTVRDRHQAQRADDDG